MVAAAAERLEALSQSQSEGLDSLEPQDVIRHFTSAFRHHDTTKHTIVPTFGMPAGLSALPGAWKKIADLLADVTATRLFEFTALEEFGHLHAAELW
jgi:hypothetical protein